MRSKSWLFILVLGIAGFCALGFLTKFALESNPTLVRIVKLKQAIAEDFSAQGVEEVSVRSLPQKRGYELRIEAPRGQNPDPAAFARSVAECFLKKYTGQIPPFLKLTLIEPGRFGFRGETVYFEKEFAMNDLATDLDLRAALSRLEAALPAGFRLRPTTLGEPLAVAIEVPLPRDEADQERTLSLLRKAAEEHLSAGRGRNVVLTVWSREPAPRLLAEERLERPVQRRRQPRAPSAAVPAPVRSSEPTK